MDNVEENRSEDGEQAVVSEKIGEGWTVQGGPERMAKTICLPNVAQAIKLGRRLVEWSFKEESPLLLTCDGTTITVELETVNGKFTETSKRIARRLRPSSVSRYQQLEVDEEVED